MQISHNIEYPKIPCLWFLNYPKNMCKMYFFKCWWHHMAYDILLSVHCVLLIALPTTINL